MMHHPNIHHQAMSGHPGPQHIQSHQGVPTHHQLAPHQMHRDQTRISMSQPLQGNGMQLGQAPLGALGGLGGVGPMVHRPPPLPHQPPPHQPPPMRHHRPHMQHSQHMPPMRRPFLCGTTPPLLQQRPPQPAQLQHSMRPVQHTPHTAAHQPQPIPQTQQPQSVNSDSRQSPVGSTTELPLIINLVTDNGDGVDRGEGEGEGLKDKGKDSSSLTNGTSEASDGKLKSIPEDDSVHSGMANSKEKTPMCLVNELARFNKIKHQYRLTRETGPAHKKRFTVALRLDEGETAEEFVAEGGSIKRAQHAAAGEALLHTRLPPPPPKPPAWRRARTQGHALSLALPHSLAHRTGVQGSIMPTVELNALAMKLCQPAVYHVEPPIPLAGLAGRAAVGAAFRGHPPPPPHFRPQGFAFRGFWPAYRVRGATEGAPLLHRVRVEVGAQEWHGEGPTSQAARHAAAAAALRELRPTSRHSPPCSPQSSLPSAGTTVTTVDGPNAADADIDGVNIDDDDDQEASDLKSPVSLVHEMALKRNLSVTFKVKNERGPPHMKVFVTTCTVGDLETEGEGNGKRISKRRAAEAMVEKMKTTLPPIPQQRKNAIKSAAQRNAKRKQQQPKKRARNLIKEGVEGEARGEVAASAGADEAANPISLLAVRQATRRARSPQYRLLEERGQARRRCFLVECLAPGAHGLAPTAAQGQGPNKKAAKRSAARNVLIAMGVNIKPDTLQTKPLIKNDINDLSETTTTTSADTKQSETAKGGRKVTFSTETNQSHSIHVEVGGSCGRQLVPGLLLMQDHANSHFNSSSKTGGVNVQATATIAKELLLACTSPTSESLTKQSPPSHNRLTSSPVPNPISSPIVSSTTHIGNSTQQPVSPNGTTTPSTVTSQDIIRPKDQLLYLAQHLGFQVQFLDFPKGNHGEYLSLVTLSTEPPLLCHGGGATTERSHEQAARAALESLSRMGLDSRSAVTTPCSDSGDSLLIGANGGVTKPNLIPNGLNK